MDQNQQNTPGQGNQQMPQYPPPYRMRKRSVRWWIPLSIIGGILALIIIIFASIWGAISNAVEPKTVEVKTNSVLYVTFDGGLNEYEKTNPRPGSYFA